MPYDVASLKKKLGALEWDLRNLRTGKIKRLREAQIQSLREQINEANKI